jgi:hypothetical protein
MHIANPQGNPRATHQPRKSMSDRSRIRALVCRLACSAVCSV